MTYAAILPDGREIPVEPEEDGHPPVTFDYEGSRYTLMTFSRELETALYRPSAFDPNNPMWSEYVPPWKRPEGEE